MRYSHSLHPQHHAIHVGLPSLGGPTVTTPISTCNDSTPPSGDGDGYQRAEACHEPPARPTVTVRIPTCNASTPPSRDGKGFQRAGSEPGPPLKPQSPGAHRTS